MSRFNAESRLLWAQTARELIGECYDYARPFIDKDYDGLDPFVRFVVAQLFIDCHLSSESALILVGAGKEWDADILNRAVMEGSYKLLYMLIGDASDLARKANEYWNILPKLASVRRSERAKGVLEAVADPDSVHWRPLREALLADAEITAARQGMNRSARKSLEEQWSFAGISRFFSTSDIERMQLLAHMAHGYGY